MIKSRRTRLAVNLSSRKEKRNAYRIFVGMPEGEIPLG
jgi:hypothetical protein